MMNIATRQLARLKFRIAFRRLRAIQGLTSADVAEILGVHHTLYSHIENGRRPLTHAQRKALARLFKCKMADIPEMPARRTV